MNKAYRTKLASILARTAEQAGAIVEVRHEARGSRVNCTFPRVCVSFDLDSLHDGGILASWYGATDDLAAGGWGVDSVNLSHRRKATMYGRDDVEFCAKFYRACRAVVNGSAFADSGVAA